MTGDLLLSRNMLLSFIHSFAFLFGSVNNRITFAFPPSVILLWTEKKRGQSPGGDNGTAYWERLGDWLSQRGWSWILIHHIQSRWWKFVSRGFGGGSGYCGVIQAWSDVVTWANLWNQIESPPCFCAEFFSPILISDLPIHCPQDTQNSSFSVTASQTYDTWTFTSFAVNEPARCCQSLFSVVYERSCRNNHILC